MSPILSSVVTIAIFGSLALFIFYRPKQPAVTLASPLPASGVSMRVTAVYRAFFRDNFFPKITVYEDHLHVLWQNIQYSNTASVGIGYMGRVEFTLKNSGSKIDIQMNNAGNQAALLAFLKSKSIPLTSEAEAMLAKQ